MLFFGCCWLSFVGVVMCVLMFIFVCMVMNIYDDFKIRKIIYKNVGPSTHIWRFLNQQLFLGGFGFCVSSIQVCNLFESSLQSGNFLVRFESEILWTLNVVICSSSDVRRLEPLRGTYRGPVGHGIA